MVTHPGNGGATGRPRGILLFVVTFRLRGWHRVVQTKEEVWQHAGHGLGGASELVVSILVRAIRAFALPSQGGRMCVQDGRTAPIGIATGFWLFPFGDLIVPAIGCAARVQGPPERPWERTETVQGSASGVLGPAVERAGGFVAGRVAQLALLAVAVVGLAALVVVASGGWTPAGTSASRQVPDVLLDAVVSLGLVLLLPGAAILLYGLAQRREIAAEIRRRRYPRSGLAGWAVFALLFALLTWYRGRDWRPPNPEGELEGQAFPGARPREPSPGEVTTYEPELTWIPVAALVALVAVTLAAHLVAARRERTAPAEALAHIVAGVVDEALDDLHAEPDARRAVIAAFARLERAFATSGLPRARAETAHEYLPRALRALEIDNRPARTLASLYEVAQFSLHEVDAGMKAQAIAALQDVRAELRRARTGEGEPPRLASTGAA